MPDPEKIKQSNHVQSYRKKRSATYYPSLKDLNQWCIAHGPSSASRTDESILPGQSIDISANRWGATILRSISWTTGADITNHHGVHEHVSNVQESSPSRGLTIVQRDWVAEAEWLLLIKI